MHVETDLNVFLSHARISTDVPHLRGIAGTARIAGDATTCQQ